MEPGEWFAALDSIWAAISNSNEFWSAIAGAVVGGLIAYAIQSKVLREGRRQGAADQKLIQETLGNGLVFKVLRIHSNIVNIHRYIEECFKRVEEKGAGAEPWQFYRPLANPPMPVHFSSDEMAMLLGLKDLETFNRILPMDVIHNSLMDAVNALNGERRSLAARFTAHEADGAMLTSYASREEYMALRPDMIGVNSLAESLRSIANDGLRDADDALRRLHKLLHERLGIEYKLELKEDKAKPPARM